MWTASPKPRPGAIIADMLGLGLRKIAIPSLLIGLVLLAGCGDDDPADPGVVQGEPVRITSDLLSRHSQGYFITGESIRARTLIVDVSYSGGCSEHSFRLYVSSDFMESTPVQTFAFLVHEGDDACREAISEVLEFDLNPLVEEFRLVYGRTEPIRIRLYEDPTASTDRELIFNP